MNNKGLTLVELLAVLIILSVISTIIYSNISSSVSNKKEEIKGYQKEIIKEATETYIADQINDGKITSCTPTSVRVSELISKGYLDKDYEKFKNSTVNISCSYDVYTYIVN